MNLENLIVVLNLYEKKLNNLGITRDKYPDDFIPSILDDERMKHLKHVRWMLREIRRFAMSGNKDKAFRWFGFVQGVLWTCKIYSIHEMKNHNRQA